MNIYFSHGKEGSPNSIKILRLSKIARKHGFSSVKIDDTDTKDPAVRANRLRDLLNRDLANNNRLNNDPESFLLVGSSMGGYASMICASEFKGCQGVFLLAPALFMPHYPNYHYTPKTQHIHIVHGINDKVVPVKDSQHFAKKFGCTLHLVEDGHRLVKTLEQTTAWFEAFLIHAVTAVQ